MRRCAMVVSAVLLLLASPGAQDRALDQFFDEFAAEWMRADPNGATSRRYFTGDEQRRFERELTPLTDAYRRDRIARARRGLTRLHAFDRGRMSDAQRLSVDVLDWQLQSIVDGEPYLDFTFPLDQFQGANIGLVDALTTQHPLVVEADANNYLARLGQVASRMDDALADAQRMAAKGTVPPRFILRATMTQMQQFIGSPAAENPFVTTLGARLQTMKDVPPSRRDALLGEAAGVVTTQIYPAWRRGISLLDGLMARATDDAGVWKYPQGAEVYAYQLRRNTTTKLTAEEIHQIGLKQVARIEQQMDDILRQLGRTQGSVNERVAQLKKDLGYPLTDEGRTRIMADVESILRDGQKRSMALFDLTPKSPVIAEPFPRFREANAAGNYTPPSPDGSRPGTFRIPLRSEYMTRFGLRSLVYHETVPGHHFQVALEIENDALPRFRRTRLFGPLPALGEGWGLYAEWLAAESHWYDGDLEGLLGQLNFELFRARRLVVDTGLHTKHWTRQQAIDYGIEASEIERYVVNPGQACAYMLGQLKIIELREKARTALGARFSERDYHTAVLRTGTVPLEILERQMDAYIQTKR
jgi:uncharacterized protein (DUF885 family)